jgi:hypothetical protein
MSVIRIYQGKSKPANKKPGWQQREAEYQAWLDGVNSQKLGFGRTAIKKPKKLQQIDVKKPTITADRLVRPPSLQTPGGAATKAVPRPEVMYKGNAELIQRERQARERKFNTAPAYNKGNDIFVTEEELTRQLVGARRR